MPFFLLLLVVAAVGAILLIPKTAQAYVRGQPVTITVAPIGDYSDVLREDAAGSWLQMKADASNDGIILKPDGPNSAFRTHEQQLNMLDKRPTFAAQIDYSPHQAGIAVDVDLTDSDTLPWLQSNAANYNWFPLSPTGAAKEPWHWEYHG